MNIFIPTTIDIHMSFWGAVLIGAGALGMAYFTGYRHAVKRIARRFREIGQ